MFIHFFMLLEGKKSEPSDKFHLLPFRKAYSMLSIVTQYILLTFFDCCCETKGIFHFLFFFSYSHLLQSKRIVSIQLPDTVGFCTRIFSFFFIQKEYSLSISRQMFVNIPLKIIIDINYICVYFFNSILTFFILPFLVLCYLSIFHSFFCLQLFLPFNFFHFFFFS